MNSPGISKWAKEQEKRDQEACLIESGLLGNSLFSYYTYRLKFFLVRTVVAALIFAIEVKILLLGLGQEAFTYALGPRILVGLLSAFWWACLEVMRSEIRELKRNEKSYLIPRVIAAWRTLATKLSEYAAAIGLLVISLLTLSFPEIASGPLILYWVSLVARTSVDISIRTYHSSVYATRRVYRPLLAILGTEILGLILFLSLKPTIGAWSVGVSALIGLAVGTWITYHYTKKTFNHLGYTKSLKELKENPKPNYPLPPTTAILKSGIPLTLFRLDSIIGILLIGHYSWVASSSSTQTENPLGVVTVSLSLAALAVCIPILQAAQEWSQLLYFDYKKLELKSHYWLRKRFESGLKYVGTILCLCLWLLTPILTRAVDNAWTWPSWQFLCLLLTTSMCGQQAMRIFSLGSQKELLLWGISLCLCLGLLYFYSYDPNPLEVFLKISVILLGHTIAMRFLSKDNAKNKEGYLKAPTQWLTSLKNENSVHGGYIRLIDHTKIRRDGKPAKVNEGKSLPTGEGLPPINYLKAQVARELARSSKHCLKVTSLSKNTILFYCKATPKQYKNWRSRNPFRIIDIERQITAEMGNIVESFEIIDTSKTTVHSPQNSKDALQDHQKDTYQGIAPSKFLELLSKIEPKLKACQNDPYKHMNLIRKNLNGSTTDSINSIDSIDGIDGMGSMAPEPKTETETETENESLNDTEPLRSLQKEKSQKNQSPWVTMEDICLTYQKIFPKAHIIKLKKLKKLDGLNGHDSRNILSAALRYHNTLGLKNDPFCKNFDVTSLDENGALTTIFAIPRSPRLNPSLITQWRRDITTINLVNAWSTQK